MWASVKASPAYEVSSDGQVRRVGACSFMSAKPRANGYRSVCLSLPEGKKRFYVHRLVAEAFCGGCPDGMQVNHINFCRHDNRAANLEVVSCAENAAHSKKAGRYAANSRNAPRGEASLGSKVTAAQVHSIRERAASGAVKAQLAREFGITKQQISNIVRRISWA